MIGRYQLPTSSPLHVRALSRGLLGALGRDEREQLISHIHGYWGATDTILVDSGTSALRLAIEAVLAERPGVIAIPAYACYDVATAVIGARARVILYDVDPGTLAPVPDSLQRAAQHSPCGVVLIHLYGIPLDIPSIARILPPETVIIEDAAQGFGTSLHGIPAGAHGHLGILSFGRGKGLTGGAGGALITRSNRGRSLMDRIRHRDNGSRAGWSEWFRTSMQWMLARPSIYAVPASIPFLRLGETVFRAPHEPAPLAYSAAAMVRAVWNASHNAIGIRQAHAKRLVSRINAGRAWRVTPVIDDAVAGYLRLPLRHMTRSRAEILTSRARRLGIAEGYPRPLSSLSGLRELCVNSSASMPGADELARSLITLPTHGLLSASDLAGIEEWLLLTGEGGATNLSPAPAVA